MRAVVVALPIAIALVAACAPRREAPAPSGVAAGAGVRRCAGFTLRFARLEASGAATDAGASSLEAWRIEVQRRRHEGIDRDPPPTVLREALRVRRSGERIVAIEPREVHLDDVGAQPLGGPCDERLTITLRGDPAAAATEPLLTLDVLDAQSGGSARVLSGPGFVALAPGEGVGAIGRGLTLRYEGHHGYVD